MQPSSQLSGLEKLVKSLALLLLIIIAWFHFMSHENSRILNKEIAREMNKPKYIPSDERIELQKQYFEVQKKLYPDISRAESQISKLDKLLALLGIFGPLEPGECMQGVYVIKNGTKPDMPDFSASGSAAFGKAGGIEGAKVEWFYRDSANEKWVKFREAKTGKNGFDGVILKKPGEYRVIAYYGNAVGSAYFNITPEFMLTSAGVSSSMIYLNVR